MWHTGGREARWGDGRDIALTGAVGNVYTFDPEQGTIHMGL